MKRHWKKHIGIMSIILIMALLVVGCSKEAKVDAEVAAVVNGVEISMEDFNKNLALYKMDYELQFGSEIFNENTETGLSLIETVKSQVLEKMITDEVLLQLAKEKDVSVDKEVIDKSYEEYLEYLNNNAEYKAFTEENGLDEAFVKELIRVGEIINAYQGVYMEELTISEEEARTFYDENPEYFIIDEVKARHILVDNLDLAEELLERIKQGESFEELAKEYSTDPGTKDLGGDLGYFAKGSMVAPFDEAAFSMEAGDISDPVQTDFGYHIIKVEDKNTEVHEFEDSLDLIVNFLKATEFQKLIDESVEKAEVVRNITTD
ncbi:peptidylprolyl isomerase [Alkaliphilus crotonatoxidans]